MFDWGALHKRITTGTCPRLKEAYARGVTHGELLREVTEQERLDPPSSPVQLPDIQDIGEYAAWMDAPMSNVLQDSELHQRLRSGCAIFKQRLIGINRVKTHWRLSHKEAWDKEVYEPCSAVLVNFAAVVPRMPPLTHFNVLSCARSVLFANYTISTACVQHARSQSLFRIDRTRKRPST